MKFHEKLQELRKNKKLTQEELAEILYVSRTAISKWESGRGYPSIDSLKQIALFFDVTIDDLLSSEKLLTIAKQENDSNIKKMCEFMFGIVDICLIFMVLLPLYPYEINDYVYSINLFDYHSMNSIFYWIFYILLIFLGMITIYSVHKNKEFKIADLSIVLSIALILLLALTRQTYATCFAFLLFVIKLMLFFKQKNI